MEIKIKEVVQYKGHNLSANGSVNLSLKAMYSELTNTIKLMQLLNNDISIKAKLPGSKPMNLGSFRLKQITIDDDGESTIRFNGLNDFIEMDNLNLLPMNNEDTKEFVIMFESNVEVEGEEDDDTGKQD